MAKGGVPKLGPRTPERLQNRSLRVRDRPSRRGHRDRDSRESQVRTSFLGLLLATGCTLYLAFDLSDDWFPWDEGGILLSATRVLSGALPHKDYHELYTGGLTYLNAVAVHLFGSSFLAPRLVLLAAFGVWVWCLYEVAREFLTPPVAAATTILAGIWSVPNYPAAVPSWYNLFLATGALFALLRFTRSGRRSWLVAAGLCAGLSILAKISGVFLFAASILSLSYMTIRRSPAGRVQRPARSAVSHVLLATTLTATAAAMVLQTRDLAFTLRYTIPVVAVGAALVAGHLTSRSRPEPGLRPQAPLAVYGPYALGVAVPMVLFIAPFVTSGALWPLVEGVLLRPRARLATARFSPSTDLRIALPLFTAAILIWGRSLRPPARTAHAVLEAIFLGLLLLATLVSPLAYRIAFLSIYHAEPIVLVGGCILLTFRSRGSAEDERLFALLAVTAYVSLVQVPYSSPLYFLYIAPLVLLCVAAVADRLSVAPLGMRSVVSPALFLALFGGVVLNRQPAFRIGSGFVPGDRFARLALPGSGLNVIAKDSVDYARVDSLVRAHGGGRIGYAGPDAPEMYVFFESPGLPFTYYDFLERPPRRTDISRAVTGEPVIVVNRNPAFSPPIQPATLDWLRGEFPNGRIVGRFEVRWRGQE
jgi:hypothetical protein